MFLILNLVFPETYITNQATITLELENALSFAYVRNLLSSEQKKAYDAIASINWKDCFYRNDIGYRAIEREKN